MAGNGNQSTLFWQSLVFAVMVCSMRVGSACVLPPVIKEVPTEVQAPHPSVWKYVQVPLGLNASNQRAYVSNHASKLLPVQWTVERENMCLALFPGRTPPVSPAIGHSQPVCVLSHDGNGGNEHAVYYVEYNQKRNLPNLVAYNIPGTTYKKGAKVVRTWGYAQTGLDRAYGPLPLAIHGSDWCASHPMDGVCTAKVGTRGHLATMSAFQPSFNDMYATCVYLNTFPSRQPFDGKQWNRFENANIKKAKAAGGSGLFVVAGTMAETAGTIPSHDLDDQGNNVTIDVPVWVWSAYADMDGLATVAHICSDGGPDDTCGCQDNLDAKALQAHTGFDAFPGLSVNHLSSSVKISLGVGNGVATSRAPLIQNFSEPMGDFGVLRNVGRYVRDIFSGALSRAKAAFTDKEAWPRKEDHGTGLQPKKSNGVPRHAGAGSGARVASEINV